MKKTLLNHLVKFTFIIAAITLVSFTTVKTSHSHSRINAEESTKYNIDGKWYSRDTDGTDLGSVNIIGSTATYSKFPTTKVTIKKVHNDPFQPVIYVTNVTNGVAQHFAAVLDEKNEIIRFYNGSTWRRK